VEDLRGEAASSLKQYLQRFLSRPSSNNSLSDLYVLVYGWNQAQQLLSQMGIDTSQWSKNFLPLQNITPWTMKAENHQDQKSSFIIV
jgi:hypothetical protein